MKYPELFVERESQKVDQKRDGKENGRDEIEFEPKVKGCDITDDGVHRLPFNYRCGRMV